MLPLSSSSWTRFGWMSLMRPFVCTESVRMPAIGPVREMADWPSDLKAIASNAMETCSPVVSSMSISRAYWYGSFVMPLARVMRSSVVSPIADTTMTIWSPGCFSLSTLFATFMIFSVVATELPPNFFTISAMFLPLNICRHIRHKRTAQAFCLLKCLIETYYTRISAACLPSFTIFA